MFVTARVLAAECGVSEKTILQHAAQMERDGYMVKSKIGRPVQINREKFLSRCFPGWREEEENHEEQD
jgi:biotin operon repressor